MNALIRKHWPLFSAMGLYWAAVIVLVIISVNKNQGHLVYPLDDTYIHMAIAKNVVLHHVWGMTRYEFTSSTSSPLWILLLAGTYLIFGVNEVSPLVLNALFGTLTILALYLFLARNIISRLTIFVILLVAVFVTPLPTLTVIGMEHTLHTFLSFCFVYFSIEVLSATEKPLQRYYVLLIVLSPLVTAVRYEGIFLVFVVCVLLLLQRRFLYAVTLGIIALLPVIIYGLWSISNGWYFFPNSVILKAHIPVFSLKGIIELLNPKTLYLIQLHGHILFLLIASLFLLLFFYHSKEKSYKAGKYANLIFIGCLLLHMQFVPVFYFYRYEAYIVLIGIIVISISAYDLLSKKHIWKINAAGLSRLSYYLSLILLILVFAYPFCSRAIGPLKITLQATHNIYEQQYQMGMFLKRFYQGRTVAVNDIGAVCFLADIRLLDLWGLGSMEPAKLRREKLYITEEIYNLSQQHGVAIAIVYDSFFATDIGGLPPQWVPLGKWRMPDNVICGDDNVTLYAVDPSARGELKQNLRQFAPELPADVEKYVNVLKNDINK